jgi:hypothetical protein
MITLPNIDSWRREEHYVGIDLAGPYALTQGARRSSSSRSEPCRPC